MDSVDFADEFASGTSGYSYGSRHLVLDDDDDSSSEGMGSSGNDTMTTARVGDNTAQTMFWKEMSHKVFVIL